MIVGCGIDVVEIERIARVLARRGDRFVARVFAPAEIAACAPRTRAAPHFAVRFAAKEALLKALGRGLAGGARWVDVETAPDAGPAGGPVSERLRLKLHGRVAEMASEMGIDTPQLAVSRTRTHALAVVVCERRGP